MEHFFNGVSLILMKTVGLTVINYAALPKFEVSVVFKRFLLHNWHLLTQQISFNFVLKKWWLSMLIIRLFKFEWRHLEGLLVIVAAEKIFHSNTLEMIVNISFYLEHFWTMRSSESLKSGLILSIFHSVWKNFKVTGWSSSPICHK